MTKQWQEAYERQQRVMPIAPNTVEYGYVVGWKAALAAMREFVVERRVDAISIHDLMCKIDSLEP